MNDREQLELLELAAKAAGIDARWVDTWDGLFIHVPHKLPRDWPEWNPLTDDGDALRLAVKLGLDIDGENCLAKHRSGNWWGDIDEDDEYAAMRRAIVFAAAEVGKDI